MHATCIPGTPDHVSDLIGINGAIKQCQNVVEVLPGGCMHATCIPGTPDHVSDLIGINGAIKQC